jgi:hypothetical protein
MVNVIEVLVKFRWSHGIEPGGIETVTLVKRESSE